MQILKKMATNKTNRVADIHGDQILIDGQWFHAERVFGRCASQYIVGQRIDALAQPLAPVAALRPDEMVGCALYRGCSSNEMDEQKISAFVEFMLCAGGWGDFPMITGYVETLDEHDVEQCETLVSEGCTRVWIDELGWSRVVATADIGTRYVHIDNGHHRIAAAVIASGQLGQIFVPVADLKREEDQPRFT